MTSMSMTSLTLVASAGMEGQSRMGFEEEGLFASLEKLDLALRGTVTLELMKDLISCPIPVT